MPILTSDSGVTGNPAFYSLLAALTEAVDKLGKLHEEEVRDLWSKVESRRDVHSYTAPPEHGTSEYDVVITVEDEVVLSAENTTMNEEGFFSLFPEYPDPLTCIANSPRRQPTSRQPSKAVVLPRQPSQAPSQQSSQLANRPMQLQLPNRSMTFTSDPTIMDSDAAMTLNMSDIADLSCSRAQTAQSTSAGKGNWAATNSFAKFLVRRSWHNSYSEFDKMTLQEMVTVESAERPDTSSTTTETHIQELHGWLSHSDNVQQGSKTFFCMLHPVSKKRATWLMACMAFLMYDLIMVPFDISFDPEESLFSEVMDLSSAVFWTLDIPMNFASGIYVHDDVVMNPLHVARVYVKTWFVPDIFLVLPEWLTYVIKKFPARQVTTFRMVRWGRLVRLLRLARVIRIAKLRPLLRRVALTFHLSSQYVMVTRGAIGVTIMLLLLVHLISCVWYAFGNVLESGWVQANGYASADLGRAYVVSARWSFSRLHGLKSSNQIETTSEMLLDCLLIYASLILSAFYIGKVTTVSFTGSQSKMTNLWKASLSFAQRRKISPQLQFKVMKVLEASHFTGVGEIAQEERMLLETLPGSLQQDLLFEARKTLLIARPFFKDLYEYNPRALRHVCNGAITQHIAIQTEVVFAYGDASSQMLVADAGKLRYFDGNVCYETSALTAGLGRPLARPSAAPNSLGHQLKAGDIISEPALWTAWEHRGQLKAASESALLRVDADQIAQVLMQYKTPLMHAIRYAKHFVWSLNQSRIPPNDMTCFADLTIDRLDKDLFRGSSEDHFIFISHYKVEAGTEATLMRDLLLPILNADASHPANNLRSPIFIDSEDLHDLARLEAHVVGSHSLVLLLTPGVLSRPWCLIELVAAMKNNVNVVLVDVQRPGISYDYPDEDFYAKLVAGELLNPECTKLLASQDISLADVESTLRQMFLKIALPFSPHKSKTVREAELRDIFKRCQGATAPIACPWPEHSVSWSL